MRIKISVAAPQYPSSLQEALSQVEKLSKEAAATGASIVCFPESYLPGYPIDGFERESCTADQLQAALQNVCDIAREHAIAIIIPMDWYEGDRFLNVAHVISASGERMGFQAKNQLDPSEDRIWDAGEGRHMFEVDGLRFGIVICHEGFRYPETVRWAARQGAHVVFHPHLSGSSDGSYIPTEWASKDSPYYEKAQMSRALENTIYFATSNYTLPYPEATSAVIDPTGNCIAYQPYDEPGVLVVEIDTDKATGLLAKRFRPGVLE
jgi:predicted amidohydrolase